MNIILKQILQDCQAELENKGIENDFKAWFFKAIKNNNLYFKIIYGLCACYLREKAFKNE